MSAGLCQPPALLSDELHRLVAALSDEDARRYLRLMIATDPETFERFAQIRSEMTAGAR